VGEAIMLVPDNVCVATRSKVGMGVVQSFDHSNGGVDVDWSNQPAARRGDPRIVLDAHVGVGRLEIGHSAVPPSYFRDGNGHFNLKNQLDFKDQTNTGCEVANAG
jgi:hypothetical protein